MDSRPLLLLPAEVRNTIYELVAGHEVVLEDGRVASPTPALLLICRQVYDEYKETYGNVISTANISARIDTFAGFREQLRRLPTSRTGPTRNIHIQLYLQSDVDIIFERERVKEWLVLCLKDELAGFRRTYEIESGPDDVTIPLAGFQLVRMFESFSVDYGETRDFEQLLVAWCKATVAD